MSVAGDEAINVVDCEGTITIVDEGSLEMLGARVTVAGTDGDRAVDDTG